MRYILIILLFCSVGAKAQMVIKAHANYRPYAAAVPFVGLLDDYPNAAAAYSLRKLDKDYSGSAIRVRRSSDNTESDIGFTSSGDLDTATLKTFVGANNGLVVTWYDQSGNALNLSQSSASNQPKIINSGTIIRAEGKIIVDFFGAFLENSNLSTGTPKTIFTVYKKGSLQADEEVFFDSRITSQSVVYKENNFNGDRLNIAFGTNRRSNHTFQSQEYKLLSIIQDGNNGNAYINGSSIYGANVNFGSNSFNGLRLGAVRGTASLYLQAGLYEFIIYGSNQSSNRTGIENNINDYYNIYWNGDFTGLLDTYPSSAAAYSLRNLSSTYLGPLIRVRRSNDNAEQDIFGDYYGNLDTASLKTFVGANNGRVVTWYDQSGNARNKTNSTASTQPEIMFLGVIKRTNGKPCLNFQNVNVLTSASTYTITHHVMVARVVIQSVINYSYTNANNGFFWNGSFSGVNGLGGFDGTNVRSITGEDLNQHLGFFSMRSNKLFITRDGGTETDVGTFAATITVDRLGGRQNASSIDFVGEVQEVIAWNSDQSSNRSGIQSNINTHYVIY